jgi:hypothetical protein
MTFPLDPFSSRLESSTIAAPLHQADTAYFVLGDLSWDALEIVVVPDSNYSAYHPTPTTYLDWANVQWGAHNTFDNNTNFGSEYDIFSGTPETTTLTVDGDGKLTSGQTKGWYKVLDDQDYSCKLVSVNYAAQQTVYPYATVVPDGGPSSTSPTGINQVGYPMEWTTEVAASGWNIYQQLYMARAKAYCVGVFSPIPYFVGRVRYAGPVWNSPGGGLNPSCYKVDYVTSGFLPNIGGAVTYEVPFPAGSVIPQPSPSEPFTSGHSCVALSNPFESNTISAVLPIVFDINFVIIGQSRSAFAADKGFTWGEWQTI